MKRHQKTDFDAAFFGRSWKIPNKQFAQIDKKTQKSLSKNEKNRLSYPQWKERFYRKKRVIHEVMHIIHKKTGEKTGLHRSENERAFC